MRDLPRDLRLPLDDTAVLLIDWQERLHAVMPADLRDRNLRQAQTVLAGARELGLPLVITEQYPKGLGRTLPALRELHPDVEPVEKLTFSCCGAASITETLDRVGRSRWLIVGMETHVCVYQTVLDLLEAGRQPHVLADAVLSRRKGSWRRGLALCERAGAVISETEIALFQLLRTAGHERFRAVSRLVK